MFFPFGSPEALYTYHPMPFLVFGGQLFFPSFRGVKCQGVMGVGFHILPPIFPWKKNKGFGHLKNMVIYHKIKTSKNVGFGGLMV